MDVIWPDQCIVFDLPSGSGGMAAGIYKKWIMDNVIEFITINSINLKTYIHNYKLNIWFSDEKYYIIFFLWFNSSEKLWRRPYILEKIYNHE